MTENLVCPYCGNNVSLEVRRLSYDEKVTMQCPNCGGHFEYVPGFGALSLPDEGSRKQPRIYYEGSYPSGSHDSWDSEPGPRPNQNCSKCCAMCVCLLILTTLFPLFWAFWTFWG